MKAVAGAAAGPSWVRDEIGGHGGLTLIVYKEVPAVTRTGRASTAFMLAARRQ